MNAPKPKRKRSKKTQKPVSEPVRPNYFRAPTLRPEILESYGRRVARIIGDAEKGDIIVASVAACHVSTQELATMHEAEIIVGGFDDKGRRDSSPIVCNV